MFKLKTLLAAALMALSFATAPTSQAVAADKYITVASTTSTANSGLFDFLLPKFTEKTGIEVRVVAVGTGKAIKLAMNGDADVLFVHHKPSELKFVKKGFGVKRTDVMYNDFVMVGPKSDPAGVKGTKTAADGLKKIAAAKSPFASRGDNSGTNKKELELWKGAGIDPTGAGNKWYSATGSGMGATLNVASGMNAYSLTDRATWLKFKNKGDLTIVLEGDPVLFNQYGIILVNPKKHPHVKTELGQTFIDWVIGKEGQGLINEYKILGNQAFFANAQPGA
ncbi:substrate-binding domain-containing protein [Thalassospiraceae bacterium LMO-JJ14]|nr:substrate-binding domain-containing protein [Thalassospiraceae bacterium LMO-JJ14]